MSHFAIGLAGSFAIALPTHVQSAFWGMPYLCRNLSFYMADIQQLEKIASQVRRDIVRQVYNCQSGHPGGSLGCTDFLVALYFDVMQHDPKFNMNGSGEDMFFLSNGHISPVWYSVLARSGTSPPRLMKARAPPLWEMQGANMGEDEAQAQSAPESEYQFDQRVAW